MKPFGFTEGVKYPALLNVHGGPHTQYGNVMFDEFQAQAGAGHVVIYTNPRGSQGYGEAFTRAVASAHDAAPRGLDDGEAPEHPLHPAQGVGIVPPAPGPHHGPL